MSNEVLVSGVEHTVNLSAINENNEGKEVQTKIASIANEVQKKVVSPPTKATDEMNLIAPKLILATNSIKSRTTKPVIATTRGIPMNRNSTSQPFIVINDPVNNTVFLVNRNELQTKPQKKPALNPYSPKVDQKSSVMPVKYGQSLLKPVERRKATSLVSSAPSTVISSTVTHANGSLIYREPVTTNDTASFTNDHEHKIVDQNELSSSKQQTPEESSSDIKTVIINRQQSLLKVNVKAPVRHNEQTTTTTLLNVDENFRSSNPKQSILRKTHTIISDAVKDSSTEVFPNTPKLTIDIDSIESDKMETSSLVKPIQKRIRAKSAYMTDAMLTEQGILSQRGRAKSDDKNEYNICNLDALPERTSDPKVYRNSSTHDKLFNLIQAEKQQSITTTVKSISISGGNKKIQINNGQLSDAIRLLDKSSKQTLPGVIQISRSIQSHNAAIALLPKVDKKRKLLESMQATARALNSVENDSQQTQSENDVVRRTYSRSKSVSVKSKMQFKVGNLVKAKKEKIPAVKNNPEWQSLCNVLTMNRPKLSDTHSSGSATPHVSSDNSRATSPTDIEQCLSWSSSKSLARLPSTDIILQRNEFGSIEIDPLSMQKIKAIKLDKKEFPKFDGSMACGHPEFAGCFNAIVQRLNGAAPNPLCRINEKNPHQYYSIEFKEIIGALVQKKNNNCEAITLNDIMQALYETNMFDRTKNSSLFSWARFIDYYNKNHNENERIKLAPTSLFVNTIPTAPNNFEIGQKLEAIDPQNSSLFCVCTIVEKCGYRLKLRFDGYSPIYDFWVNADSTNIFPAGYCSKTGRDLEVKSRFVNKRNQTFEWKEYLRQTNTQAAHQACFPNLNTARTQMNPFKIGMKLEAEDTKNTNRLCVSTIGDVIDNRVLITLDGLDSCYNYWCHITSPYIHPVNFHQENGWSISSPPGWRSSPFSWESYLRMNRAEAVPKNAFHTRKPKPFAVGMALEVVDKKNPSLIRPAIITNIDEYQIKVLFIGWPERYAYWIEDDSTEIFPPDYCKKTGHPIECPLDDFIYELAKSTCETKGCRGIGNGKQLDATTHSSLDECPYEILNWSADEMRANRIDRKHKSINAAFNIGAGPSHKVSVNPALEKVQVSLQKTLNPAELAAMSSKDVENFRRLQVSAQFLLANQKSLSDIRNQWMERLKPLRPVQVLAAKKNPLNWSVDEVVAFVSKVPNCSTLGQKFVEHEIDGLAFLSLRQSDMIDIMGLTVGSAIKIFNRIVFLREECNTHYIRYD